jgi:hypothetical protein
MWVTSPGRGGGGGVRRVEDALGMCCVESVINPVIGECVQEGRDAAVLSQVSQIDRGDTRGLLGCFDFLIAVASCSGLL